MSNDFPLEPVLIFLLGTPFFEKLEPDELQEIIHLVDKVAFLKGDTIFNEGDPGDAWYVVYKGAVDVLNDGNKITSIGPQNCFGEMSILDKLPRSATVVASVDSVLLRITSEVFVQLIKEDKLVAYKLIHEMAILLSHRQRTSTEKLSELIKSEDISDVRTEIRSIVENSTVRE
ncbi:Crp/Fnr family transcriptional regulator [Solemya velum gill symbiont]|uniref:Crp/Fnr family transcriptional regulator n=1 Tax=Solemya velum gill symbiont TaxID=2340 RepID=UPI000996FCE7|nr:cyclic nucleotide-binding domain-containing protein [Solemya velum gill symbiont]OOY99837.1 hypothetical protein BOW19_03355 [Solemya velum gill symbiont]OOZ02024.1 hypothetical protein BOW20_03350 [Solemya velum gill symbiont]OOZ04253.1 hypothetical protein BOW21_02770 [Solemya velum gill symbiont]OOZ06603.1 hypothetical protein BOW22_03345 [Solemya velum gill symbiont]OOZ08787.1 hypothetical protein BOW23_03340 [Solemya velum gill symbiont]